MKGQLPQWVIRLPWALLGGIAIVLAAGLARGTLREAQAGPPPLEIALNFVLRLIPFALLLLALALAIEVVEEEAQSGSMTAGTRRLLYWVPRVAALLFVAFLSLFALDVFEAGVSIWQRIGAFLLHLIPAFILLGAITIAWKWEWVGALGLVGWAVFYVVMARGFPWEVYVALAGLPFVLGLLFLLNWRYRGQLRNKV